MMRLLLAAAATALCLVLGAILQSHLNAIPFYALFADVLQVILM